MAKVPQSKELSEFLKSGKLVSFKRKETILMASEESTPSYYWIKTGYIKVISYAKSGSEKIHFIYGPNDLFPVGWLLTGSDQWVSFAALSDVEILIKSVSSFEEFITKHPFILSEVKRMQLNANDRIYSMSLDSPEERIAHSLLMLSLRFGVKKGEHTSLDLPLSRQEFADMVRMSRETAGKVLNELEDRGCLVMGRKRILINPLELSKVLES